MKKEILKRISKDCVICGRDMVVILYTDKTYRGGHYFGKINPSSKKENFKTIKHSTKEVKIGNLTLNALKHSPKTAKSAEYWECPKCYWD